MAQTDWGALANQLNGASAPTTPAAPTSAAPSAPASAAPDWHGLATQLNGSDQEQQQKPAEDTGIVAGVKRNTVGAITGIYHALTDPVTDEEKIALKKKVDEANKYSPVKFSDDWANNPSPATLAYHRIIDAPMEQLAEKSQKETDVAKDLLEHHEYWKGGNAYLSGLTDRVLSKVPMVGPFVNSIAERAEGGDFSGAATDVAGAIALEHSPEIMKYGGQKAADLVDTVRSGVDSLRPSPDEAAQIALAPSKKKAIMAQKDLTGARPYLEGATNLKELQDKAVAGKAEVWAPYTQAVNIMDQVPVKGPDGVMTTVGDLEKQRLQTSAELDKVRKLQPTDYHTQIQKDGVIKELSDKYTKIINTLDPELAKTGIDPQLIRTTHGQIQGVYKTIEGRNTLTETAKKYGLSKMFNIDIAHPLANAGNAVQGLKDLVTGRPWFSGKPTEVAVQEGFRTNTAKPNLVPGRPNGVPTPPAIKGLLGAAPAPIAVPGVADTSGIVQGYKPEVQPLAENRQLPAAPVVQPPTRRLPAADVTGQPTYPYGQPGSPLITPNPNERPLNVPRATATPREVAITAPVKATPEAPTAYKEAPKTETKPAAKTEPKTAKFASGERANVANQEAPKGKEWLEGERQHEITRLKKILRDPKATPEEIKIAGEQLYNYLRPEEHIKASSALAGEK